jgi:hypothetical protein
MGRKANQKPHSNLFKKKKKLYEPVLPLPLSSFHSNCIHFGFFGT